MSARCNNILLSTFTKTTVRKIRLLVLVASLPFFGGCGLLVDSMFVGAMECHNYGGNCPKKAEPQPVRQSAPDNTLVAP